MKPQHQPNILDGKGLSLNILDSLKPRIEHLEKELGITPGLATILVGQDPASHVYIRNKRVACEKVGLKNFHYDLPEDTGQKKLLEIIQTLNEDQNIHGILVQLPLPKGLDYREKEILESIIPSKDADGFHPTNQGALMQGNKAPTPCTPKGIMRLLEETGVDGAGKKAVVIGRSNIVGKPVAMLLLAKNFTVTICHAHTKDLFKEVVEADVIVVAVGVPELVKGKWIKPGAIVIDVGINRKENGKLVGDVEFEVAKNQASFITPVPGGVGPMTIAMLLSNTIESAELMLKEKN